jgi:hypothetical protein
MCCASTVVFTTASLLLYYCFTTALLLLYYCFTTAVDVLRLLVQAGAYMRANNR